MTQQRYATVGRTDARVSISFEQGQLDTTGYSVHAAVVERVKPFQSTAELWCHAQKLSRFAGNEL